MDVTIRKTADGPYVVEGNVRLVDADGNAYEVPERFSLCRCGKSRRAPFCDGAHNVHGFKERSDARFNASTTEA